MQMQKTRVYYLRLARIRNSGGSRNHGQYLNYIINTLHPSMNPNKEKHVPIFFDTVFLSNHLYIFYPAIVCIMTLGIYSVPDHVYFDCGQSCRFELSRIE